MNNNAAVKDNIKLLNKIYEIDNIEEPMKLIDIILNDQKYNWKCLKSIMNI